VNYPACWFWVDLDGQGERWRLAIPTEEGWVFPQDGGFEVAREEMEGRPQRPIFTPPAWREPRGFESVRRG